ncbi:MAG: hypothetical protein P8Y02_05125 [Deinococcales bacterium]
MKRILVLLTFLALVGLASAQSQLTPLPDNPKFDQKVELTTGANGESLRAMVSALAQSVGLTAIVNDVPDKTITYDIGSPKPFRQVWNIVLQLNDLDYALLPNNVVVVGPPSTVDKVQPKPASTEQQKAQTPPPPNTVQKFYKVHNDPQQVVREEHRGRRHATAAGQGTVAAAAVRHGHPGRAAGAAHLPALQRQRRGPGQDAAG